MTYWPQIMDCKYCDLSSVMRSLVVTKHFHMCGFQSDRYCLCAIALVVLNAHPSVAKVG
jgi:hypothetical protein